MNRLIRNAALAAIAVFIVAGFGTAARAAENGRALEKQVVLLPGESLVNPYQLFYDIRVPEPGEVRVYFETGIPTQSKHDKFTMTVIAKSKIGARDRKFFSKSSFFRYGKTQILRYAIDAVELEKAGPVYRVLLSNYSKDTLKGMLVVAYPGHVQRPRPDLAIERIFLDSHKKVNVVVKNVGEGLVSPTIWYPKTDCFLDIELNGRYWGGIAISKLDQARKLQLPGGSATYTRGPVINGETSVKATVDAKGIVPDPDKANNAMEVTLPFVVKPMAPVKVQAAVPSNKAEIRPMRPLKPVRPAVGITGSGGSEGSPEPPGSGSTVPNLGFTGDLTIGAQNKTVAWGGTITLTPADATAYAGGSADFPITYSYKELNGVAVSSCKTKVVFHNANVGQKVDVNLGAGAVQQVHMVVHLQTTQGKLKFKIDPGNKVAESQENDNKSFVRLKFSGF